MKESSIHTVKVLGWSGLLPFAFMPLAAVLDFPDWLQRLLLTYAVIILAFMAGTLWARFLVAVEPGRFRLIASNVLALAAWPAVLLELHWAALWLALVFAAHLLLDEPWRGNEMPGWYRRLRLFLSSSVIALLVLTGLIGAGRVL
ncbi:MAG: DUF3429 domain-containing protein [Wenzhouxiangella sp.]|nr:DUF3429 domain-containing protein [Wenzhouxiangella sp.]